MALRPDVPYSPVGSVSPNVQQPGDSIRVQASPSDFGGQIGQATQGLGGAVERGADEASQAALQIQAIYNKTAVDHGYNQHQDTVNNLLYGDPNNPNDHGFMSLTGADAMQARAGVMQQMEQSRQTIGAGMNQVQKNAFDDASRRLNQMVYSEVGQHANQQFMNWSAQTQTDTQSVALKAVNYDPFNEQGFQRNYETGMQAAANRAHLMGLDPTAAQLDFQNSAYTARAQAMGATDPVRALSFVTANQGKLTAGNYATLVERLKPKANAIQATSIVDGIIPLPGAAGLGPAAGAVQSAALTAGVNPIQAQTVAQLESQGGAASDQPGNTHTGVFQMGNTEFAANNPGGTRGNVTDEATAGVNNLARVQPLADAAVGGKAQPWQTYLMHQQGDAGGAALLKADPSQNAVDALAPAYKGDRTAAAAAISGNGGDPNGTVGQFTSMWQQKYSAAEQRVRGNTLAGGPQPYPDVAGLEQKVLNATPGDPDLQHAAMSDLHQRLSLLNVQTQQARDDLSHTLAGTKAALLSGDTTVVIPETSIRAAYPQPDADRMLSDLNMEKQAGRLIKSLQFATPDDVRTTMADLATPNGRLGSLLRSGTAGGIGTPDGNALPPETPGQTVERQQILSYAQEALTARAQTLKNDPATYAAAEPGVASALKAIDPKDPATFETYARATLGVQKALGVADSDTRVLSASQSEGMAKQLISGDPATTDAGAQLDGLAKQYGSQWPAVWHDLVRDGHMPPEWQVLGAMPAGPDRMQMQRALQVAEKKGGVENMRKDIDPQAAQSIDRDIDGVMDDFRKTVMIPGLAGNADLYTSVRSAVRASTIYGVMTGQSEGAALNKAVAGALPYDFVGTARAPKGMGGQAETYGANLLSGLKPDDIGNVNTASTDMQPAQTKQAYTAAVQRSGVWVTNERDDGWALALPDRMGGYQLVTKPDGSRVGFKFSDMARGAPQPLPMAQADTPTALMPGF